MPTWPLTLRSHRAVVSALAPQPTFTVLRGRYVRVAALVQDARSGDLPTRQGYWLAATMACGGALGKPDVSWGCLVSHIDT
jgi:hypothetical protein